ncbi:MAG: lipid II flippase MurJ [Candidatus Sungiibacteriota bacterium]
MRGLQRMNFLQNEIASVHIAALILGAAGLASRILGMVRDRLLAAHFGAGRELDIYNAAFNIPDFMATLFLLGGATAAILPMFQEYAGRDRIKARQFIAALAVLFLIGSTAAALAAFFVAPFAMRFIVPGFSPADQASTLTLTRMMLLAPVLLGLSGIFSVVVQSSKRFFIYALAPIFYNLGIILGIIVLAPVMGIAGVAVGVVIGAALHMGLQAGSAITLGPGLVRDFFQTIGNMRERLVMLGGDVAGVVLIAGPRVLAVSLAQLTLVALDAIGSTLAPGSVAMLGFAQNLYFVPVGIFGVSYATAIFPRLVSAAASRENGDFFRELAGGIRSILFWVAPAAALCIVLRAHIVRVALGAGAFSWEDTRIVAAVLAALALAMIAGSVQTLLTRAFYALGNTWIPLAVNAAASLISIALAVFFIRALALPTLFGQWIVMVFRVADIPHPEVVAIGLGFAAGLIFDAVMLYVLLVRCARKQLGGFSPGVAVEGVKIIGAAVIAGAVAYLVRANFSDALPLITWTRVFIEGTAAAAAGFAAYVGVLALIGNEDVSLLRRAIARRLFSLRMLPPYWDGDEIK